MAESSSTKISQPRIIEVIVDAAKKAFDPSLDSAAREPWLEEYNNLVARTGSWTLLSTLNSLIKPDILPPWLRSPLLKSLTLVPLKADGVRGTLEFVFSVHPSSNAAAGEPSQPQKSGANITHDAVAVASKLLSSVPSDMTPEAWFSGISEQFFRMLDGEAGHDLARTAAQIVGFGILGKRQLGAPGAPGWNVFVQPLLEDINPSLRSGGGHAGSKEEAANPEVVELIRDEVLVPARSLEKAVNRLGVLILSNPSPGLCRRVLKPVITQLWCLSCWNLPPSSTEQRYCGAAHGLVQTYLGLFSSLDDMMPILRSITCAGSTDSSNPMWRYILQDDGGIAAVGRRGLGSIQDVGFDVGDIERKAAAFVAVMTAACPSETISAVFLHLLSRWIETRQKRDDGDIHLRRRADDVDFSVQQFIESKLMQQLMEKAPEKLVYHFDQLLEVIHKVLAADGSFSLGDDLIAVVLSLLNLVMTAPSFQRSAVNPNELQAIEKALGEIGRLNRPEISTTAKNLEMLLKHLDELGDVDDSKPSAVSVGHTEDRKTYNLAMNYMTAQNDNPPPVVSEGLNLLSSLIVSESPILDITAVTVLMSTMLKENEDYINLRVVKIFTQLANHHPKSTVRELLDNYLDPQERASTDIRLRFGEALVQVIERLGETFSGSIAQEICETLLSIAGRRGYRPKTLARKEKEERLHKRNMERKGDDDMHDYSDAQETDEVTAEEQATDMLTRIIQGWESKRGSEDIRMRASALSIFGVALETNIRGVGAVLASDGVDLCAKVLTLEPELEFGILRRAAVVAVLSFVRALDNAKESSQPLGFGLTDDSRTDMQTTLEYVAQTDNDGLVQQHARDVVESLKNWRITSLLPGQGDRMAPALTRLAGLQVNPDAEVPSRPPPRIEEVE